MTEEEMVIDIASMKMFKRNPTSHPTIARAYTIVLDWQRHGLLPENAHAEDDDILEKMKRVVRSL